MEFDVTKEVKQAITEAINAQALQEYAALEKRVAEIEARVAALESENPLKGVFDYVETTKEEKEEPAKEWPTLTKDETIQCALMYIESQMKKLKEPE